MPRFRFRYRATDSVTRKLTDPAIRGELLCGRTSLLLRVFGRESSCAVEQHMRRITNLLAVLQLDDLPGA